MTGQYSNSKQSPRSSTQLWVTALYFWPEGQSGAIRQNALFQGLVQHGVGIITDGFVHRDAGALLFLKALSFAAVRLIWSSTILAVPVGVIGTLGLLLAHTVLPLEGSIFATVRNVTRDTVAILLMIPIRTFGLFFPMTSGFEFVPFVSFLGALWNVATDTFILPVISPIWTPGVANNAFAFAQNTVHTLGPFVGDAVAIWGQG